MNKKMIIDWAVRLGSVAAVAFLAGNLGTHGTQVAANQTDSREQQQVPPNVDQQMPEPSQELPGFSNEMPNANVPDVESGLPSEDPWGTPSQEVPSDPNQQYGNSAGEYSGGTSGGGMRQRRGHGQFNGPSGQSGQNGPESQQGGGFFSPGVQGGDTGTQGS